jgi:hypothetical protein
MPRFTYGAQFSPEQTPLPTLLGLLEKADDDRDVLQKEIQDQFFATKNDSWTLAGNCILSLNSYKIIEIKEKEFSITTLGKNLIQLINDEENLYKQFSIHIMVNLEGLILLRLIENMRTRGEPISLEAIGDELNEINISLPTNSTYISVMRVWLEKSSVFEKSYEIRWDIVDKFLGINTDTITELYKLSVAQKYFLLSMAQLGAVDYTPSNNIAHHARNIYRVKITTKSLGKDVLEPLVTAGLIESRKATAGSGAKPTNVRLTEKGNKELLAPLLEGIATLTGIQTVELNKTFSQVVTELKDPNKNVRGLALELFAIWIIRMLGLRFSRWRVKSSQETGGGEIDVIAASDKITYSRWQIQCKNTISNVDIDTIAKEVGMTFKTKADIIMVITTADFTNAAIDYSNQVSSDSRYYVILLNGNNIKEISKDRSKIIDILNNKARRVFAQKELGTIDDRE